MAKRAIDLSVEELAAMGTKAARLAVQSAQQAGLTITGTIDTYNEGQAVSTLAQLLPSGTVTLVQLGEAPSDQRRLPNRRDRGRDVD
jgi:hypothetical protein